MSSQPSDAKPTPSSSSTKPPVTLHPTAHLADGAYVKGPHSITIGANTLVHPRAYILSIHSPLTIDANSLIHAKATIGAPLPTSTTTVSDPTPSSSLPPTTITNPSPPLSPPNPTVIGSHVQIHPHATIHHSITIANYSIIESHATLLPGARIGEHSKICSGITISGSASVPEWTVVHGNGEMRRLRKPLASVGGNANDTPSDESEKEPSVTSPIPILVDIELPENQRILSLSKEREAATTILRTNAKYLNVARQKAQQREGARVEKVR